MGLRRAVSTKVLQLRNLQKHPTLYAELISMGLSQEKLDAYIKRGTIKDIQPISSEILRKDLKTVFGLGGVVSGGAAVAYVLGHKTKDFDVYFNDDFAFVSAYLLTHHNPYIDVCWYFEEPHELHDMAVVMINVRGDGTLEVTKQAQRALDTKISDIYVENVIWPTRTAKRLMKYHKRLGMHYPAPQLLSLMAMHGIDLDMGQQLLDVCAA